MLVQTANTGFIHANSSRLYVLCAAAVPVLKTVRGNILAIRSMYDYSGTRQLNDHRVHTKTYSDRVVTIFKYPEGRRSSHRSR